MLWKGAATMIVAVVLEACKKPTADSDEMHISINNLKQHTRTLN
jgi:hypothetical protein